MPDIVEFKIDDRVYMTFNPKNKVLTLDWSQFPEMKIGARCNVLKTQFRYKNDKKVAFLLKKQSLEKIKDFVDRRMMSSYTDIMAFIVTYYNEIDDLTPSYGQFNDFDSYSDRMRIICERLLRDHEAKYGSSCWN